MKLDNKTICIAASILFFWRAFNSISSLFSQIINGTLFYISPLYLIMLLYGIVVQALMGYKAAKQQQRGKLLNRCGIVYIAYVAVNLFTAFPYSFNLTTLISLVLLIAAFVLSQKACGGAIIDTNDTTSEAAKTQIQAQKQTTIYDEQLRDGILTQEEYDQIMKNKHSFICVPNKTPIPLRRVFVSWSPCTRAQRVAVQHSPPSKNTTQPGGVFCSKVRSKCLH